MCSCVSFSSQSEVKGAGRWKRWRRQLHTLWPERSVILCFFSLFLQFVCWRLLCGFWLAGQQWNHSQDLHFNVCVCTSVSLPVWEVWVSHRCSETLLDTSTLLSLFTAYKTWLMNYRFISWGRHEEHKTKVHKTSVEKTKKWKFYVQTKLSVPDFEKQKHQMLNVELQISNTSLLASVC